jgi:hypothetical protein
MTHTLKAAVCTLALALIAACATTQDSAVKPRQGYFFVGGRYVETDRGPALFLTHNIHETPQPIPGRYTLTDLESNRYDIPDVEKLDAESRRIFFGRV